MVSVVEQNAFLKVYPHLEPLLWERVAVRHAADLGVRDALDGRPVRVGTPDDGDRTAAAAPWAYLRGYAFGEAVALLSGLDLSDLFIPTAGDALALRGEG